MVVSDTNVLTSFAAARGLDILLRALSVQIVFIPPAVKREIEAGLARHVRHLQSVLDMMTNSNGDPRRIVRVAPERGGRIANVNEL